MLLRVQALLASFIFILTPNYYGLLIGQITLALFIGMFTSSLAALTANTFSTLTRYSGIAISLNIGASIFGGTAPLVATSLAYYSGNEMLLCVYIQYFLEY